MDRITPQTKDERRKTKDDIHGTNKYEHTDFAYSFVQMHRDDTIDC